MPENYQIIMEGYKQAVIESAQAIKKLILSLQLTKEEKKHLLLLIGEHENNVQRVAMAKGIEKAFKNANQK